jgi:hypothetical protein
MDDPNFFDIPGFVEYVKVQSDICDAEDSDAFVREAQDQNDLRQYEDRCSRTRRPRSLANIPAIRTSISYPMVQLLFNLLDLIFNKSQLGSVRHLIRLRISRLIVNRLRMHVVQAK